MHVSVQCAYGQVHMHTIRSYAYTLRAAIEVAFKAYCGGGNAAEVT